MKEIQFVDRASGDLVSENPPGEKLLKFFYQSTLGKLSLDLIVKRKLISSIYGRMMSRKSSKNKITDFVQTYKIDLKEAIKSLEEFTSFNDFFYRKLKPEARPIGEGIVSPGDGKLLAFESIGNLQSFFVKGHEFTLDCFLQNQNLADEFKDAAFFILRLAPNDYHRFHFPYAGIPEKVHAIKGSYFSVSPYALAENFARVFCENKRTYTILKTTDKGRILLSPVGATMVGSIHHTYEAGKALKKGDEMGYFSFGGSTVVILVPKDSIVIDADLLENTKNRMETAVKMGERLGV
ncbi:archaetidylserine decarboxylase [Portibacter lacus]|uniref:phosphatidylserine decarboxylase n=1 Tax=Portibacter lacus TaxID=1099794 RepID=A0AA37WFU2_9BACT|nr:archaetidylserine decarboxylase [Portibacter lacus]GLR17250.1 phosphatidylserine decarboxylase proenzyme [Portibacter lacus]